jgi:branched-chain amino acid transport system substrate-binding protein
MRTVIRGIVTAALAALLAFAGAAGAQGAKEIVFGYTLPLSGPFAFVAKDLVEAIEDYFAWVNAQGGIRGQKVKLAIEDTAYKVDQAMAAYKKMLASDKPIALYGDGTGFIRAASPENNDRYKVLMTSTSFASDLVDGRKYPFHFVAGPTYAQAIDVLLKHIRDTHQAERPKVALLHSATEFGRDPVEHFGKRAAALGMDVVLVAEMKLRDVDVTPEVIKLRQAKPDYTIIHGFGGAPVYTEVMKLAREYRLTTKFLGTFWESSRTLMKRVGDPADGYLGVSNYAWNTAGSDAPMLKVIDGIKRGKNPQYDGYPDIFYMQGWLASMIFHKAVEATLDAKKPLTGDNLREALRGLKDWDTGGVVGAPVTFKDNAIPLGQIVRFDAKNGMKPVPVSPWIRVD